MNYEKQLDRLISMNKTGLGKAGKKELFRQAHLDLVESGGGNEVKAMEPSQK